MAKEEMCYTMGEISIASGISVNTLYKRAEKLGIKVDEDKRGYTLEQAKLLVKRPVRRKNSSPRVAEALRCRLKNDGYL